MRQRKKIITALIVAAVLIFEVLFGSSSFEISDGTSTRPLGVTNENAYVLLASPPPRPTSVPSDPELAQVTRIIDGDTIEALVGDYKKVVRIIGINTPETVDPRKTVECFGNEASAYARAFFVDGVQVELRADPSQQNQDKYGRLLRYVFKHSAETDARVDYGLSAIQAGMAHEYTYQNPHLYQAEYRVAEIEAEKQGMGLWADGGCEATSGAINKELLSY